MSHQLTLCENLNSAEKKNLREYCFNALEQQVSVFGMSDKRQSRHCHLCPTLDYSFRNISPFHQNTTKPMLEKSL